MSGVAVSDFDPFRETTRSAISATAARIVTTEREDDFFLTGALLIGAMPVGVTEVGAVEILLVDAERVGTAGTLKEAAALLVVRFAAFLAVDFFADFLTAFLTDFFAVAFLATFFTGFFFAAFFAATNNSLIFKLVAESYPRD